MLHGPIFLPRLSWWAYGRARRADRRWLLAEAAWAFVVPIVGVLLWPWTSAVLVYAVLVFAGC